jgi:hypothetical protein
LQSLAVRVKASLMKLIADIGGDADSAVGSQYSQARKPPKKARESAEFRPAHLAWQHEDEVRKGP